MKTIWKYPIKTIAIQQLRMPEGAQILTVQEQRGQVCLWALVDENGEMESRHIETIGTGHPITGTERVYIGTYQLEGGDLIFHVFDM